MKTLIKNMLSKQVLVVVLFVLFCFVVVPYFVFAQDIVLLEPLPSPDGSLGGTVSGGSILSKYLKNIFNLSIGVAGILSVLMIVIGGVQYVGSSVSPSQKEEAKKNIQGAVLGLIIVIGAYAILATINPDLVNFNLEPPSL